MAFFGSVLRDDFNPDSDVDMKLELQEIFKRDVDIVEDGTIRNPIKRRCIYENQEVIYESTG